MEKRDPVCGMTVDSDTSSRSSHQGQEYFFCSSDCQQKFEAAPEQYAGTGRSYGGGAPPDRGATAGTEPPYTETHGFVAPKYGSAGSGGAEYERIPEQDEK